MSSPYLLMSLLYLAVAVLAALDVTLSHLGLVSWMNGLRWLRIHFITLGLLTETVFGVIPLLVAARLGLPRPRTRWDIWLLLNAGLPVLLVGIPLVNPSLILAGGTLIFLAATLLALQLAQMKAQAGSPPSTSPSRRFYVTGLIYLLVGILVGTGLWLGWSGPLRIQVPLEVHIHANNWGFMSLVFAGLLVDLMPRLGGQRLASPRTTAVLYWMTTLGALGLVAGPWLGGVLAVLVPGLVLHLAATLWLVVLMVQGLWRSEHANTPGAWHMVTAYAWILAPVLMAPLVLLKVPGIPNGRVEGIAPQALIYGWVLQFGLALVPYLARRLLLAEDHPRLGGTWASVAGINLGSLLIWVSIFAVSAESLLQGLAYGLYALATLPVLWELAQDIRAGWHRVEAAWSQSQPAL